VGVGHESFKWLPGAGYPADEKSLYPIISINMNLQNLTTITITTKYSEIQPIIKTIRLYNVISYFTESAFAGTG
jgi:hypothetical protein